MSKLQKELYSNQYYGRKRYFNGKDFSQSMTIKEKEKSFWKDYCNRSSIHGLRYLSDENSPRYEKLIWTIFVLTSITLTIVMYVGLADQYSKRSLQTVVENSQYPVFLFYYPSVAICTHNHITSSQIDDAQKYFLPNASTSIANTFKDFVKRFISFQFGSFSAMEGVQMIDFNAFDHLNLTAIAEFLTRPCEDHFEKCIWRNQELPCCEIFVTQATEVGFCHIFNSMVTSETRQIARMNQFYPFRESNGGEQSGLKVFLKASSVQGMGFMIKRPQEWSGRVHLMHMNTEIFTVIRPKLTVADEATRVFPPEERNCIFTDEKTHRYYKSIKGLDYRQPNCITKCHAEYVHRYCKCTVPLLFPEESEHVNLTDCKPSDLPCFLQYADVFSYEKKPNQEEYVNDSRPGMLCPCLPSCDELNYAEYVTHFALNKNEKDNASAILNVYFEAELAVKYRTKLEYSTVDLIANFGAILGLFLGASIMSGVEFIYYSTVGLFMYIKQCIIKK